jgi:hypothetical protein
MSQTLTVAVSERIESLNKAEKGADEAVTNLQNTINRAKGDLTNLNISVVQFSNNVLEEIKISEDAGRFKSTNK